MPMFDLAKLGTYVFTAFLGAWVFKLFDLFVSWLGRQKEIERTLKIELARLEIKLESAKQEGARSNDAVAIAKAIREYNQGVALAHRIYAIDIEELGPRWLKKRPRK